MTIAELLTDMVVRGVEFRAHGDKLRFRPMGLLTPEEVENIRRHKLPLLALLRSEGLVYRNPAADPRPLAVCDRCGSTSTLDKQIHGGRSMRRDCAACHRFLGWPRWYDQDIRGREVSD